MKSGKPQQTDKSTFYHNNVVRQSMKYVTQM